MKTHMYNHDDVLFAAIVVLFIIMFLFNGCAPKQVGSGGLSSEIYVHDVVRRIKVEKAKLICPRCGSRTIKEVGAELYYCVNPKCKAIWKKGKQ